MISRHSNTIDLEKVLQSLINNATEKLETCEYYLFNCHPDVSIQKKRDFLSEDVKAKQKAHKYFAGF
jgi:hypothetical protein